MKSYDKFIEEALKAIPEQLRAKLKNIAFLVEDGPGPACECGDENCHDNVLGLYEGLPLVEREGDSTGLLPDKITLFRSTIEDEARDFDLPVEQVVYETVWHEVSHYFGFDEEQAERMERKWEQNLN